MQYQVLVKKIAENGYVASVIGAPDCVAEGQTEEDAVNQAKSALKKHLAQGKIITIEVDSQPESENPLLKHAGRFKDDPYFDEVMEEIEKYRRELDAALEAKSIGHPLLKHFGRFKDDPTFDDYLANIEAYRKQLDAEEAAKEASAQEPVR